MLVKEFYKLVRKGWKPIVKLNENYEMYVEESANKDMICKVISACENDICEGESYRFELDFRDYEEHNKIIATHDWRDNNGVPCLTWFETKWYTGIDSVYLPMEEEIPFEIIENNSLYGEYLNEKSSLDYVKWLEETLIKTREWINKAKRF